MPNKKKTPSKRSAVADNAGVRAAVASGKGAADEVIAFRAKQRRKRAVIDATLESEQPLMEGLSMDDITELLT